MCTQLLEEVEEAGAQGGSALRSPDNQLPCASLPLQVKARPATPSISKQFVVSDSKFEFGPLLVGKDATG